MSDLKTGDLVRWETDVDKVHSAYTKTFVGKMGKILPPQEYYDSPHADAKKYLTPAGFFDVEFSDGEKTFTVGNIPESELVSVAK
jgi:hypothetical protein